MRQSIELNEGWIFRRGRAGSRWLSGATISNADESISLPHCWNRTDTFQQGVSYYRGPGAYRKRFVCPQMTLNQPAWLCSDGFYGVGDIWLNGKHVSRVDGQYLGFHHGVGDLLRPGNENTLAITLTNRCGRHILPGIPDPDFLLYGGLAGGVWLEMTASLYMDTQTLRIEAIAGPSPHVEASFQLVNSGDHPIDGEMVWALCSLDGTQIHQQIVPVTAVPENTRQEFRITLPADGVALWSPDNPHLYAIEMTLRCHDRPVDRMTRRIGFRTAEFRPDQGFFLNGERLLLRGCNRHESMPGCGNALSGAQHRADAEAIHNMGLNFVRLSHYPQSPLFLDACDALGILVYAELASWKSVRGGRWLRGALRQFGDMIIRDRHHPSVIIWGMGNEGQHRGAYQQLRELAQQLDPQRPVIYAENHLYRARRKGTIGLPDVWGCNYELDALEVGRDAARQRCVIVSECSNAPYAERGILEHERAQIQQLAADIPKIEAAPYVAGFALWCFNDYATLRKSRYLRYSGIVDAWREPKLAAAWLAARYGNQPFLKLASDWQPDSGSPGVPRRVDVFTSVAPVEVQLNQRLFCTIRERGHQCLEIPFEAGRLEAIATGKCNLVDTIETFGAAKSLSLAFADAYNAMLHVTIHDSEKRLVRNWKGSVSIATEGTAHAYAYRPDNRVHVAGGMARIPIAIVGDSENAVWTVSAPGLESATITGKRDYPFR